MFRPLPNALQLVFNRLAAIPVQLKREAMPPKRRTYRKKRRSKK